MKFNNLLSDDAVMAEIGHRIAVMRIDRNLTQAELADAAGVSKRTVERLESGETGQLINLIRCLRALDGIGSFERLLPDSPANPMSQLRRRGEWRRRMRASRRAEEPEDRSHPPGWTWGDKK